MACEWVGGQILLGEVRFENLEVPRPVKREQYGGDQGDCEPEGACLHEAESGWGAQHKEHEQQGGHKQGAPQAGLSIVKLPHAGQSGHFVLRDEEVNLIRLSLQASELSAAEW